MEQNAFVEKKTTERSSAKKTVTIAENDDVISKVGESFSMILYTKDIRSPSLSSADAKYCKFSQSGEFKRTSTGTCTCTSSNRCSVQGNPFSNRRNARLFALEIPTSNHFLNRVILIPFGKKIQEEFSIVCFVTAK